MHGQKESKQSLDSSAWIDCDMDNNKSLRASKGGIHFFELWFLSIQWSPRKLFTALVNKEAALTRQEGKIEWVSTQPWPCDSDWMPSQRCRRAGEAFRFANESRM